MQRIGLRAQVVSFLIEHGINEGNALNDQTNRRKVLVAVKYEAKPPDSRVEVAEINRLKAELVAHLNGLSELDKECYGQMPRDISATELLDLSNPQIVATVDLQKLSASLMLEQTSKGVEAMLSLSHTLKEELSPLKTLPIILEKLMLCCIISDSGCRTPRFAI